jgi:hypothetical protein
MPATSFTTIGRCKIPTLIETCSCGLVHDSIFLKTASRAQMGSQHAYHSPDATAGFPRFSRRWRKTPESSAPLRAAFPMVRAARPRNA